MTTPSMPILRAVGVTQRFGKFTALKNINVSFERNKLTAIIGPNGAGKSTFFNVISGAFPPTEGQIFYNGQEITGLKQHEFARIGISKSFQITNVFKDLSAHENVRVAHQMRISRYNILTPRSSLRALHEQADELLAKVGLSAVAGKRASELAHGQQRALEIAMALASTPDLLLLDEPTAGMSPEETVFMMDLIHRLSQERTVILVEHKMKLVMGICEHLIVLHHGEFLAQGNPEEIRNNAEVRRVYLGQN